MGIEKEGILFTRMHSYRARGKRHVLLRRNGAWLYEKIYAPCDQLNTGIGCPEHWWNFHHWKSWRLNLIRVLNNLIYDPEVWASNSRGPFPAQAFRCFWALSNNRSSTHKLKTCYQKVLSFFPFGIQNCSSSCMFLLWKGQIAVCICLVHAANSKKSTEA